MLSITGFFTEGTSFLRVATTRQPDMIVVSAKNSHKNVVKNESSRKIVRKMVTIKNGKGMQQKHDEHEFLLFWVANIGLR